MNDNFQAEDCEQLRKEHYIAIGVIAKYAIEIEDIKSDRDAIVMERENALFNDREARAELARVKDENDRLRKELERSYRLFDISLEDSTKLSVENTRLKRVLEKIIKSMWATDMIKIAKDALDKGSN